jgi:hypothetical protein
MATVRELKKQGESKEREARSAGFPLKEASHTKKRSNALEDEIKKHVLCL